MKANWLGNARIYQVMIDRFRGADTFVNKPDFLGGNIRGITAKLDYIKESGFNTIWLSPFWKTSKYHGYHILDYETTDPHFGTIDDLKDLIKKAYKKSLRVITDFVPNHCSAEHPFFLDATSDRKSRYYNWFYFKKWPDDYLCFLHERALPKLNLDNPETCDYMISVAKYWLSMGIAGYRIDHIIGLSHKFLRWFDFELKNSFPACVLFGEAWGEGISPGFYETIHIKNKTWHKLFGISQEKLQGQYYGLVDGILDFRLNQIIIDAASKGKGFTTDKGFRSKVKKHFSRYPDDYHLVTFLDNHDMNRFLHYCHGDQDLLLEAIEFLLETGRPVVIYYGTEMGFCNTIPVQINVPHADLNVREPVNWNQINLEFYKRFKALLNRYNKSDI